MRKTASIIGAMLCLAVVVAYANDFFKSAPQVTIPAGGSIQVSNSTAVAFTILGLECNFTNTATGSLNFYRQTAADPTLRRITGFDYTSATNVMLDKRDLEGIFFPTDHALVIENTSDLDATVTYNKGLRK